MTKHLLVAAVAFGALSIGIAAVSPAQALSMSECSAKYKAAKQAGTLAGMTWNDFRKANCGAEATAAPVAGGTSAPAANPLKPAPSTAAAPAAAAPSGPAVFPTAISPKFSSEKPAKQRMHTCLEQYKENKASGANGGLKWIQKGGGYYSECNKRLKGAA
jgi:hypothetical protein